MSKTSIEWLPDRRLKDCRTSGATMGTRYGARFPAPDGVDVQAISAALAAAVGAVDRQMSNWKPDSDLSRLNRAAPGVWTPIPAHLATVLARGLAIGKASGHAFDIGLGDLVDDWGFGPSGRRRLQHRPAQPQPRPATDALLEVDVRGCRARKHGSVVLDLCGIAKGFGVDALAGVLEAAGIVAWLVGIDGELRARGHKPDGSPWAIALESPQEERRAAMGVIELQDAAIATSGDYRHWVRVDGERLSHTMDPRTGAPLRSGIAAVSVVAGTCMDADAWATALMVLGEEAGAAQARRLGLDALFVVRESGGLRAAGTGAFETSAAQAA